MRVAVTGGTGFLGAHITQELVTRGHEPVCLVRPTSDRRHLKSLGVTQIPGAMDDPGSLRKLVRDTEAVVHVAGTIAARDAAGYRTVNTDGTRRLLKACEEQALKRFIYVSSLAAKGPSPTPRAESAACEPRPISDYGRSKLGGEQAVREHGGTSGCDAAIVRPPALYGPRDRGLLGVLRLARRGLYPAVVPPGAHVSLLYGPDCARFIATLVDAPANGTSIYEPADGLPYTDPILRETIAQAMGGKRLRPFSVPGPLLKGAAHITHLATGFAGKTAMLNPDKVRELRSKHWVSDTSTLDGLAWKPATTLLQGMQETKKWYETEGWL